MNLNNTNLPLVSVLMPVYNAASYLEESINSILNQTYTKLEFVIIDDGSTDESYSIIESYQKKDKRIVLYKNNQNIGLIRSLNNGLSLCTGKYIARMDADDISNLERIEKQFFFLENNPSYKIVSTLYQFFEIVPKFLPLSSIEVLAAEEKYLAPKSIFYTPFSHPCLMARATFLKQFQYLVNYPVAEDYELFSRIIRAHRCTNLKEVLYYVRQAPQSHSRTNNNTQFDSVKRIQKRELAVYGFPVSLKSLEIHTLLSDSYLNSLTIEQLNAVEEWLRELKIRNAEKNIFPQEVFKEVLALVWYKTCYKSHLGKTKTLAIYLKSHFNTFPINMRLKIYLFIKCLGLKSYLLPIYFLISRLYSKSKNGFIYMLFFSYS